MDFVFHPRFMDAHMMSGHPERPERVSAILGSMARADLDPPMHEPGPVEDDLLYKVHTRAHLADLEAMEEGHYDINTYMTADSLDIAKLAAGAGALTVDLARENSSAFALVRPPGHHAGPGFGGGFCLLNNIAIGAERALEHYNKVAIVDLDVHHGNGTADIYRSRSDVLYISAHQYGIFPGTGHIKEVGSGLGEGFTINVPLPPGTGDRTYLYMMDRLVLPLLEDFDPEFLLVSVGTDAHYTDLLANMGLTSRGYLALVDRLFDFARGGSRGISFFLEGGYDLGALSEVVGNIIAVGEGGSVPVTLDEGYDNGVGQRVVDKAMGIHSIMWDI